MVYGMEKNKFLDNHLKQGYHCIQNRDTTEFKFQNMHEMRVIVKYYDG